MNEIQPARAGDLDTGDILLMLGQGPLSDLIAWASDGPYSHAALVADGGKLAGQLTIRDVTRRETFTIQPSACARPATWGEPWRAWTSPSPRGSSPSRPSAKK